MPFIYRAITANCGNDVLGEEANRTLERIFREDNADFYVINCQEVNAAKTLTDLEGLFKPDYRVTMLGKMDTYTKGLFAGGCIAAFMIHKPEITVTVSSVLAARRSIIPGGSAYNKGGLIIDAKLTKGAERMKLQTVSAHLDSGSCVVRAKDWLKVHESLAMNVSHWDQLTAGMAHLRLSGYDANTRNKIENNQGMNLWHQEQAQGRFEIQGLQQAVLASQCYTRYSTYNTSLGEDGLNTEDQKRPGYVKKGSLDFSGILDGGTACDLDFDHAQAVAMDVLSTRRDHDIIITPQQQYDTAVTEFQLVQRQMAAMLARAAPLLAAQLRTLTDTPESRAQLLATYQRFLGKGGFLNVELALFQEKLDVLEKIKAMKAPPWVEKILFSQEPWFAASSMDNQQIAEIQSRQLSMGATLRRLKLCKDWESLATCLLDITKTDTSLVNSQSFNSRAIMARYRSSTREEEREDFDEDISAEVSKVSSEAEVDDSDSVRFLDNLK